MATTATPPARLKSRTSFLCDDGSEYLGHPFKINSTYLPTGNTRQRPFTRMTSQSTVVPLSPGYDRSRSALEGPVMSRMKLPRYHSQMADIVVGAKPTLGKSLPSPLRMNTAREGRAAAGVNRFSSAMAKTLQLGDLTGARKRKSRFRSSRFQDKSEVQSSVNKVKNLVRAIRKDGLTPLKRFRRAARLVKLLVTVCNVCRDLLVYAIKDEQWYEFCEKFLKDASAGGTPIDKNSFLTTIKNPVTKKFEQLEFDASQFKHDHHSGMSLLTPEMKVTLSKKPGSRTQKEIEEMVQCIKRLVPAFRSNTYQQQKQICQLVNYDKYFQERVILRENLPPDGVYFVLNGTLMESGKKMPAPKMIKPGDKFGEEDLKSGMARQTNVVTKSSCDLLYLHKLDYEEIFELTVDLSGDETRVFDVCKHELVFKYYPIVELVRNPARWQVLKFKYGRLIASNSCETEFIYIIRSGEARVIKYLSTRTINVASRRRRLQAELDSADPFVNRKKLLDFVSDNTLRASRYAFNAYDAKNLSADMTPITDRIRHISTPPLSAQRDKQAINQNKEKKTPLRIKSAAPAVTVSSPEEALPEEEEEEDMDEQVIELTRSDNVNSRGESPSPLLPTSLPKIKIRAKTAASVPAKKKVTFGSARPHTSKTIKLSVEEEEEDMYHKRKSAVDINVPPFVQVDSLHAGQTYGMRSILPPDMQGEAAALVSAGCEVIQINRKFFAKYLDDNMTSIIALKAKAYPSEEELLKRLDVNLQWEEYCAVVMCGYLDSKVASFRGSHVVLPQ